MWRELRKIWTVPEVRNGLLFIAFALLLYRVLAHISVPGVDAQQLRLFFQSNQVLGLLSLFSGGAIENFSVVSLGVGPYITASIIFQLLTIVLPRLEEIQKDGEAGRARINQWTRYATVPLAMLNAVGILTLLRQSGQGIIGDMSLFAWITTVITMTAGSVFLMWLGELITERKMGNGISLLIFANIVAGLPQQLQQILLTYDSSQALLFAALAATAVATVVGVVYITEGQRNVPVSYAKQVRGSRLFGGSSTHLPLRVNMSGVIPIIFAISVVLMPPVVAQFFVTAKAQWLKDAATWVIVTFQNQTVYAVLYFTLVVGFTYFYTAIVFKPEQIAENIQKQGGFIPGIRPGQSTVQYLSAIVTRITLAGALFLGVIAVLPLILQQATGNPALLVGGTSLLIVVSVVIEVVKQIQVQIQMHDYEGV
ncbi:preprotein translocase subunit SecY [Patescibacteria group bacterium]|nr:MAG: preprotein translocase subunit SecY [Patescibacteria group bacterium]